MSRFTKFNLKIAKSLRVSGTRLIVVDEKGKEHIFGPYKNMNRLHRDGYKIIRYWRRPNK
jgi:hypothetical protein